MIKDLFVETLRKHLPDVEILDGTSEGVLARIPAPHGAVGEVTVFDHGTEAVALIGYTHSHFDADGSETVEPKRTVAVALELAELLDQLVHDRIVMWGVLGGLLAGGYAPVRDGQFPRSSWWCKRCLWSRPL